MQDNITKELQGCGQEWFGCPCVGHVFEDGVWQHITEYIDPEGNTYHDQWKEFSNNE